MRRVENSAACWGTTEILNSDQSDMNSDKTTARTSLCGSIDSVTEGVLAGWAADLTLGDALRVALYDGEKIISELPRTVQRFDVAEAGMGESLCGFEFRLPDVMFDGRRHCLSVRTVPGGATIPGASRIVEMVEDNLASRSLAIEGMFEAVAGICATGWAHDPEAAELPIEVDVLEGDQVIAFGTASEFREDLRAAGKADGFCAFRIRLPDYVLDGRRRKITVRARGTGTVLGTQVIADFGAIRDEVVRAVVVDGFLKADIRVVGIDPTNTHLALFLDATVIGEIAVIDEGGAPIAVTFEIPKPFYDGETHDLSLALVRRDQGMAIWSEVVELPYEGFTYSLVQEEPAGALRQSLPSPLARMLDRMVASTLFDTEYFAEQIGRTFQCKREAVRHYLADRRSWRHPTSEWLDPEFVYGCAGQSLRELVSPLEWYLCQDRAADVGPNPLFSNADYLIFLGQSEKPGPDGASFFDDWVDSVRSGSLLCGSALVDLTHVLEVGQPIYGRGTDPLRYLTLWLRDDPTLRPLRLLNPCFDDDWLAHSFIVAGNRPQGCLLSAFRHGAVVGVAPHPVLHDGDASKNYYALLREYELLSRLEGAEDISIVCSSIDIDEFYRQFPPAETAGSRSSFFRYAASDRSQLRLSFLDDAHDEFVASQYPGLVDFALSTRSIGDINLLWARWLRPLGVPGSFAGCIDRPAEILTIEDLRRLRRHRHVPGGHSFVSFIIPSYGRDDLVLRCVLSALRSPGAAEVEFLVAEDAVQVDCGWILGFFMPFANIHRNSSNLGFLLNCNQAVERSSGDIFVLVNNDVELHRGALSELTETFARFPDAAVVGGMILNQDGTIQENGGILWSDGSAWNYHRDLPLKDEYLRNVREVDYVSGCWIGIRRSVWDALGGFDPRYAPAYCEEADFCLSCWQKGYKVLVNPHSVVTHLDGATMGRDEDGHTLKAHQRINRAKLRQKWESTLDIRHVSNGEPTVFHTGRLRRGRSISVVFDHYIPEYDRDAGSRTIFSICQALAAIPDNYVIFVPENNARTKYARALEILGVEVITGRSGWNRFDHLLSAAARTVEFVLVSRLDVAKKYEWHLDQLACRKALYIHDVSVLREFPHEPDSAGQTVLIDAAMRKYRERYGGTIAKFDDLLSCSKEETQLLERWLPSRVVDIFPYAHATAKLDFTAVDARKDILFIGSYGHPPNREAIDYFLEYVWPNVSGELTEAKLHVCGSGFESMASIDERVVVHGQVTDPTLAYLYSVSRASIAPLLTGAGVKGKVVEAAAHGVPCVGTHAAWQGLAVPDKCRYLTGPINTFGERLAKTYRSYDGKMVKTMLAFHDAATSRHSIFQVIPELCRRGKRT